MCLGLSEESGYYSAVEHYYATNPVQYGQTLFGLASTPLLNRFYFYSSVTFTSKNEQEIYRFPVPPFSLHPFSHHTVSPIINNLHEGGTFVATAKPM